MSAGAAWGWTGAVFAAAAGLLTWAACAIDDWATRRADRAQDAREGWEPMGRLDQWDRGARDEWLP